MNIQHKDEDEYQRAISMLQNNSVDIAVKKLERMSKEGNGRADSILGVVFEFGRGSIAADPPFPDLVVGRRTHDHKSKKARTMRSFFLFFVLAQSAWQADCQNLWGESEVIGVSAEERKIVLEVLEIQVDGVAPVLTELGGVVDDKCKRVKGVASDWDRSEVSCTIVQFPTGRIHFVVDVFDRNQISEYRNIQDGIGIDLNSNSDRKLTLNCALYCDKPDSRASAFKELSNLPMDAATCTAAMAGLNDVRAVRNYAAQLLNMSYSECKGHIGITTMFDHLIPLLRYPSHTDRNKSMATIGRIIQDPGFDGSCHWEEGVVSIRQLAEESVLPNVGGIARRIVRYIDENHITQRRLDCGGSSEITVSEKLPG